MGAVHSIDSCSAGQSESRKDSLILDPLMEEHSPYNHDCHHDNDTMTQNHPSLLDRVVTDSYSSFVESPAAPTAHNERPTRVTRSGVISGSYVNSSSKSPPSRSSASSKTWDGGTQQNNNSRLMGSNSNSTSSRHTPLRGVRRATSKALVRVSKAATAVGNGSKRLLFPPRQHHPQQNGSSSISPRLKNRNRITPPPQVTTKIRGGVLLHGCCTDDEHRQVVRQILEAVRPLHGEDGLVACGFEYRSVLHPNDDGGDANPTTTSTSDVGSHTGRDDPPDVMVESVDTRGCQHNDSERSNADENMTPDNASNDKLSDGYVETTKKYTSNVDERSRSLKQLGEGFSMDSNQPAPTMTRLFHIDSGTMITESNRKQFIADGDMYDAVARAAMEYAQEVMIRDGQIEWVTIAEAGNNPEPIRALVSTRVVEDNHTLDTDPTLLVATGKGKVRAGIFSRQHLLVSGLECSTAVPVIREARKRKMNILMLDPNVHGDRLGMVTFEKSMAHLFRRWEEREVGLAMPSKPPLSTKDLYVLSHSQSGAQFARYLLDKAEFYLPHIRAVAFTDSTHNVQWAKKKVELRNLLESDNCVYFKCAKNSGDTVPRSLPSLGQEVDADEFWRHRFGNIKTLCAGTSEHSLTNWFARHHIWNHFDHYLSGPLTQFK